MKDQRVILESLAMDLKRISIGLQRGSQIMAQRFAQEALKREGELNKNLLDEYIQKILKDLNNKMNHLDNERTAEDILMFSILLQNYSLKKFH